MALALIEATSGVHATGSSSSGQRGQEARIGALVETAAVDCVALVRVTRNAAARDACRPDRLQSGAWHETVLAFLEH